MLVSLVFNGIALLFSNVAATLGRLFGGKKSLSVVRTIKTLKPQDFEIKSVENHDATVSMNKKEIVSYICEKCSNLDGVVITLKAKEKGVPVNSGILFGKNAQNSVREGSLIASTEKIKDLLNNLQSGIEKAIKKGIYIDATCSHCETKQSWSKKICEAITIKSLLFLSSFLMLVIILFIGFSGTRISDVATVILLSVMALLIIIYYVLPAVISSQVKKEISNLDNDAKPRFIIDIVSYLSSLQSL